MRNDHDRRLLQGTQNYFQDLWRSVRIWREFRKGFTNLNSVHNCVTFFGSARFDPNHHYYQIGRAHV